VPTVKRVLLLAALAGIAVLGVLAPWQMGYDPDMLAAITDTRHGAPIARLTISRPLTLDRTSVAVGETITARVTYRNGGRVPVTIRDLVIAGRPPGATNAGGPKLDFRPGKGALTVPVGGEVTLTASRTIASADPTGTWYAFSTYRDAVGAWRDAPPTLNVRFQVTAARTPTATPTRPAPTATAAPAPSGALSVSSPLQLDRSTVTAGGTVNGVVTYRNTGAAPIAIRNLVIAARTGGGAHVDFSPGTGPKTVAPGETLTLKASRTIAVNTPVDAWTAFSSWQDAAGVWRAAPAVTLKVTMPTPAATQPAPTAIATAAPPATATPAPSAPATPPPTAAPSPTATPPAVGALEISTPLRLDRATVAIGETITGSVTYRNPGAAALTIRGIAIGARPPGGTNVGGPKLDFAPGRGATTVPAGGTVTLTASRTIAGTDPTGAWYAFATIQDAAGVWLDAPAALNAAFAVVAPTIPTTLPQPVAAPAPVGAAYYVAPGGSDANPGTLAAPLGSIQAGLNKLVAGDALVLRGGTYSLGATLTLPRSGAAGRPITIRNHPGETPVLDGAFARPVGLDLVGRSWVVLEGFTVQRVGTGKGHAGVKLTGATDITVRDLTVADHRDIGLLIDADSRRVSVLGGRYSRATTGIRVNGRDVLIDGVESFDHNRMIDNGEDCDGDGAYGEHGGQAIAVADSPGPVEIRNSRGWNNKASSICYGWDGAFVELFRAQNVDVHHNHSRNGVVFAEAAGDTSGIRLWRNEVINEQFLATHQANGMTVANNTIHNTLTAKHTNPIVWIGAGGTFGNGSTAGFSFRNNIIVTPTLVWQVLRALDASATVDSNLYQASGQLGIWAGRDAMRLADWQAATGRDGRSLAADPLLADPANYNLRPQAGSPAVDRGMAVAGVTDGYSGAAPNIGRWE
jgi:hypothetical protein